MLPGRRRMLLIGAVAFGAASLVLTTAPPEKAGAASAISETSAEFGGAVGIATLGTLAAAIYRDHMRGQVPDANVAAVVGGVLVLGVGVLTGVALRKVTPQQVADVQAGSPEH